MANTQSLIPPNIDYGKISADKYDPDGTYTKGDLRIQNNALWKSKQNIDVPEPWTESHWESTTLAAEFSSLNSRMPKTTVISGTTDEQGVLFTGLNNNTVEVLSASCSASIISPFKSSGGVWGLCFSYAAASGLLPQIREERTVKIIYVDLT